MKAFDLLINMYNIANVEIWKIENYRSIWHDGFRMAYTSEGLWLEVKGDKTGLDLKYAKISPNGILRPFERYNNNISKRHSHQFGDNPTAYYILMDNIKWIAKIMESRITKHQYTKTYGGMKKGAYDIIISFYNEKRFDYIKANENIWRGI